MAESAASALPAGGFKPPLALLIALRELRVGAGGLVVFVACIALGVAAVAAIGSLAASFEAGLRKFPADAMHRQAYGVLLARMAESGEATAGRAVKMLESALALEPSLAEAHYQLGSLALASNDAASAALHFEAAARNGLDDSRLHYATARALRRLGKMDESARHMDLFRQRKQSEELPGV
jgi:uncharacterized protein HemY